MIEIGRCSTYHALVPDRDTFRGPDGKTVFKVYYVDIIGRKDPSRTVWDLCGLEKADFLQSLAGAEGVEGIGFITAFPHITKAFRFGPGAEIVINVRAWNTKDMTDIDLARSQDYVEFACLAEALIAADEFCFWAEADSVDKYLSQWSACTDAPIVRNDKLRQYWRG